MLSAQVTDTPLDLDDIFASHDEPELPDGPSHDAHHPDLVIDLTALPPIGSGARRPGSPNSARERERQRRINTNLVRELAGLTGLGHAQINAELNRLSGVTRWPRPRWPSWRSGPRRPRTGRPRNGDAARGPEPVRL